MSTWRPWLVITTDTKHRIAIVAGADAYRIAAQLSPWDVPPVRATGGGFVINIDVAADIEAFARHRGLLVVTKERKDDAA